MRISRKVEQGEFKQRRILNTTVRDRAVRDRYRCTAPGCLQAQLWPDWLPQLPEYDRRDDCFRCPGCGARLERAGPRPASTQVVVYANRDEACRIILEAGQRVVLGRDDRSGCVGLSQYLADDITAELSRAQAALTMREGAILVEDLGSKNGTWLETRKGPRERRALSKGNPVVLDRRVRVRLASDVILELSGRRNPFDGVRLGSRHTRIDIESDRTRTGG